MRRFLLWLGILGLWSALGAQAVNLADDERLQQKLTIQQPLIPLRELLRLVQRETGVNLSVAAELQNDKVCVLAYGKPAHEILTRLAQSLRYDWRAGVDGKGYTLIQTARERARESALLRAHEQAKLHRLLKPLREIFSLLQRYPYARLQQLPERERLRLLPETRSFLKSLSPTTYELMQLAARLPESAWQGMLASSPIVFSSQPSSSGEFPIPAAVQRALREELSPSGSPRQQVRARLSCCPRTMRLEYEISIAEDDASEAIISANFWESEAVAPLRLDDHPQNAAWRSWASPASAFAQLQPRERDLPQPAPLPESIQRSPLAALIRYAREYKLDLYADAYRVCPAYSDASERMPPWSFETLHERVFWLHLEGDALMARYRDYFWLRPSEVPESALAPLEAKLRQNAEVSLDEWAQLAASLTPMQIARANEQFEIAGQAVTHDTRLPLGALVDIRPALEFWRQLSPQQRRDALAGERILWQQLSPNARARFSEAVAYAPPDTVRLTGERGFVLTSATERITALGANSTQHVNIRTPSAQRPSPHFRLEKHTITPAPRYTLEGDEVVVKPSENAAPIPAIRLVFIGADQERVYLLIPTARSD